MRKTLLLSVLSAVLLLTGCSGGEAPDTGETAGDAAPERAALSSAGEKITLDDLAGWNFYGMGEIRLDDTENALMMTEHEGSAGVTLVSPKLYGPTVTVTFKVKPATPPTVNVVMLSASDIASGGPINVPADYDGGFGFWIDGNVQNYIFAFHNGAHSRFPFITKNPGSELLVEADSHATSETWHDVEIGRDGGMLWMKVDGATVVEADDTGTPLPGGHVCFRLRGTPDDVATAYFKDVVITAGN